MQTSAPLTYAEGKTH